MTDHNTRSPFFVPREKEIQELREQVLAMGEDLPVIAPEQERMALIAHEEWVTSFLSSFEEWTLPPDEREYNQWCEGWARVAYPEYSALVEIVSRVPMEIVAGDDMVRQFLESQS
jgi:hypothetical protein